MATARAWDSALGHGTRDTHPMESKSERFAIAAPILLPTVARMLYAVVCV